jgi:hypothetical protein
LEKVQELNGGEMAKRECPKCHSKKNWKDGIRETTFGCAQRYICRDCNFRFSDKSYKECEQIENHQLCVKLEAKKLDSATELKTVVGDENSNLLDYSWRLKKRGLSIDTIKLRCGILANLVKKGAKLDNPESVETILAVEPEYNDKERPSKKYYTVKAYVSYTKTMYILWEPIRVTYEPKQAFTPITEELKLFINSAGIN